ncbi:MAG TPA: hypothetical protein PKL00_08265, partial [Bacillota bacterium]|nr:hypothetical protein [Bacillota bacterium]
TFRYHYPSKWSTFKLPYTGVRTLGYASIDFDGRIVVAPGTNIVVEYLLDAFPPGHSVSYRSTLIWYEL